MYEDDDDDEAAENRAFEQEAAQWAAQKNSALNRRGAIAAHMPTVDHAGMTAAMTAQAQAQASRMARDALVTPGNLTGEVISDPFSLPGRVKVNLASIPAIEQDSPQPKMAIKSESAAGNANGKTITFWTSSVDHGIIYGSSWDQLKDRLKEFEGSWTACEHVFPNTSNDILGFFCPDQHTPPENSQVKTFEIIVSKGKVFKAEG